MIYAVSESQLMAVWTKAVIQNVDLKFENNFGNKILTETKTSVGKHADKNSSLCYNKANDYCDYFLWDSAP